MVVGVAMSGYARIGQARRGAACGRRDNATRSRERRRLTGNQSRSSSIGTGRGVLMKGLHVQGHDVCVLSVLVLTRLMALSTAARGTTLRLHLEG